MKSIQKHITILVLLLMVFNCKAALIHTKRDGNWSSTSTWNGGALPSSTDDTQIDNNHDITIQLSDTYTITELWMGNNSSLTILGNLTIDSLHVNNNAFLNVSGTLTILGGISISNNAGLIVNTSGTMDVQGDLTAANGASLTVDGQMNISGNATFSNNGTIDVGDTGIIQINGNLDTGGTDVIGTGPINVGGSLKGANSGDSQINGSLPIELVSFNLKTINNQVFISWSTISERNNDYFTVQRSEDGVNFEDIDIVDGAGNSNALIQYNYVDSNPLSTITYYRIKQTDYDGYYEIFKPKVINTQYQQSMLSLNIYPNPAKQDDIINIAVDGLNNLNDQIELTVMDKNGLIINQISSSVDDFGQVNINIQPENLKPGLYIIWLQGNGKVLNKKLIINQ